MTHTPHDNVSRNAARATTTALAFVLAVSACGNGSAPHENAASGDLQGDPAIWVLSDGVSISTDSTTLTIDVTRVGCSSGVTGTPIDPVVKYEETRIHIYAQVTP